MAGAVVPRLISVPALSEIPVELVEQSLDWALCEPPFQLAESLFAAAVWYWTDDIGGQGPAYGVRVVSRLTPRGRQCSTLIISEEYMGSAVRHPWIRNRICVKLVDLWRSCL